MQSILRKAGVTAATVALASTAVLGVSTSAWAAPDSSTASPTSQSSTADTGAPKAGETIYTPSGKAVKLTKDFSQYTPKELTAIGIGPGQDPHHTGVNASVSSSGGIHPDNAYGVNGEVSINVKGKDTRVDFWETHLFQAEVGAGTYAVFWAPKNTVYATSEYRYVPQGADAWSDMEGLPKYFAHGTVVCNSWVNFEGKPCETIG